MRDSEIRTVRPTGRRRFLGLMAAGGAAVLAGRPAAAQAADADSGTWTDPAACPRGAGGTYTGVTDADDGNVTDAGGYGRGAPTC